MSIINTIRLYKAETNPIENIIIPTTRLRSVFFRNFCSLEINANNNFLN